MSLSNSKMADYRFLAEMYDDAYYPSALVKKGADILVELCQQIEAQKPDGLGQLYALTLVATERFKFFSYDELMTRDKASLDIFWLKDDSLDNLDDLPPPDVLQQEIIEHLEAALASFRDVAVGLAQRT